MPAAQAFGLGPVSALVEQAAMMKRTYTPREYDVEIRPDGTWMIWARGRWPRCVGRGRATDACGARYDAWECVARMERAAFEAHVNQHGATIVAPR